MAMPFLNSTETHLNLSKFKKCTKTSNFKSFWAFLLSIFIYMSAFYVFNLSPSSLLSTTKFWFFISNTLILIIAADFGTFSSSKEHDFYEEYARNSTRAKIVVPISFSPLDNKIPDHPLPYCEREKETEDKPSEKIVNIVEPEPVKSCEIQENTKPELKLVTIKEEHDHEEVQVFETIKKRDIIVHPEAEKKSVRRKKRKSKWARSKSDKAMWTLDAMKENREKMVLQRTLSERHEEEEASNEENNEFSNMSNDELNKRVEEFIVKCNRQIRLQAVKSRLQDDQGQNGDLKSRTRLMYLNI